MTAKDYSLSEFLMSVDNVFEIPPYQRTYHWEKDNVKKLLNDMEEYIIKPKNKEYYFGNIIVKTKEDKKILVDGQQRITTSILIAKCLHKYIKNRDIDNKYSYDLMELEKIYFYRNENIESKIKLNNLENSKLLESILITSQVNKDLDDNYNKNYLFLMQYFKQKTIEELIEYWNAFKKLNCVVIVLSENENENLVFESINSKGRKLQQSDLIKNYILSIANNNDIANEYNNVFLKNFANWKEELEFYRMYDCCDKRKSPESNNGLKIYESFKKRYTKIIDEEKEIHEFTENDLIKLNKFLAIFNYIKSLDICLSASYIVNTSLATYLPWIYNILIPENGEEWIEYEVDMNNHYSVKLKKEYKNPLIENLKLIATYDIKRIFCGFNRSESTKSIPEIEGKILEWHLDNGYNNGIISAKEKYKFLSIPTNNRAYQIPNSFDEDFFKKDIYSESARVKAILWLHENWLRSNTEKKSWDSFKKINIEHILPQSANKKDEWKKYYGINFHEIFNNKVNVIGNLTILPDKSNSAISDDLYEKKVQTYRNSEFSINRRIAEYSTEWKESDIDNRSKRIYDFLISEIIFE